MITSMDLDLKNLVISVTFEERFVNIFSNFHSKISGMAFLS